MQEISRSARLRKYEIAYEECIKKIKILQSPQHPAKKTRSRRCKPLPEVQKQPVKKSRSRRHKIVSSPETKKTLNSYQKFVKKESQNIIYKGVTPKERMIAISKEWNTQKLKTDKK
jgi:hypothetical protein